MRKRLAVVTMFWLWLAACGGDDDAPSMEPDAATPAAPDAGPPGPDAGTDEMPPDAAPPDAAPTDAAPPDAAPMEPDGGPAGPTIETVETEGGFTQVRQGDAVRLVVTGQNLEGVTRLVVSGFVIYPLAVTATDVRAWIEAPHGLAFGPRDVTVSGPDGSDSEPGAIEVTPYVVAPRALRDGHGTFQSPLYLCDDEVETARAGDTILLLDGQHVCDDAVDLGEGGQIVQGQGRSTTTLGSDDRASSGNFEIRLPFSKRVVTTFRDLAMRTLPPLDRGAIDLAGDGALVVERVTFRASAIRIAGDCPLCETAVTVRESSFLGAIGIKAAGRTRVDVADSVFTAAAIGIEANGGRVSIARTTFDRCFVGVFLDRGDGEPARAEILDSAFPDNQTGILLRAGRLAITGSSIEDTEAPGGSTRGIHIDGGGVLEATRVTIAGQEVSGIEAFVSRARVDSASVTLRDVLIDGGQYGVRLRGSSEGGGLFMTSTTVRDQTVAAVSYGFARAVGYDFRGGNQLSAVSGGSAVALEDARVDPLFADPIPAAGIRLNGRSPPAGVVPGPTEQLPDYRIVDPRSAIEF